MSDETPDAPSAQQKQTANWKTSVLVSVVILAIAGGLAAVTFMTEPTAQKGGATKKTAMLVDTVEATNGTFRPSIVAQGTIEPAQEVTLRPQVSGKIVELGPSFVPGGHIEEGDLLVRIESADYRNVLAQRKSELSEAKTALAVERGRQEAAQAEYGYVEEKLGEDNEALVLRKPQLQAAKDRVDAAKAAVEQARLNVRRTRVEAPFDAQIVRRDVNLGSQVSTSDSIGHLIGVEEYWVAIELPLGKLRWVEMPEEGERGSEVHVHNSRAWPSGTTRTAHLYRTVGTLDRNTRMARVLATVSDPLAHDGEAQKPPLMVGEFVDVRIEGNTLDDVVRLERDYVREDDTVWVMKDGKLEVRDVEIIVRDPDFAYITEGLEPGERVVTTNISTVVEGASLRLKPNEDSGAEEGSGE
jgi:RND family efflux transporter MFP subunit